MLQTLKLDEDCLAHCLTYNHGAPITREQLITMLMRRDNHPLRITYELILDHKNAKSRIDGPTLFSGDLSFIHFRF